MKRKLLCALLTGAMVLSAGSAVLADEAEKYGHAFFNK